MINLVEIFEAYPDLTDAQKASIEWIHKEIIEHHTYGDPNSKEFKRFELTTYGKGRNAYLITEFGLVGDEDTLASVFCRDYRNFEIRKTGKVTLMNTAKLVKGEKVSAKTKVTGHRAMYWYANQ